MPRPEGQACLGVTAQALTVTVDGKPVLVVPRERMLDLMVRIGIALREKPHRNGGSSKGTIEDKARACVKE